MKVVDFAPGVAAAEVARALLAETVCRSWSRRGRASRRPALRDHARGAAGCRRPAGAPADEGHGVPRHRRRGWHHQRRRGRPGRGQRRDLLPARPRARAAARGRTRRAAAAGPRAAQAGADRGGEGDGREAHARRDRPPDHGHGAHGRRAACDRVRRGRGRDGLVAVGQPAGRPRARSRRRRGPAGARPDRRAAACRRHRDQPQPGGQGGAGVRPRLRRQGRRLLQPAPCGR